MRPASLRMNVRVFMVFLIVGVGMLVAASYFVVGVGQARLREAWGQHLGQAADQTAAAVDAYMYRRVIDASMLARVPEVREAAGAASLRPFDRAAAVAIDQEWQRDGAAPASVRDALTSKVARYLAEVAAMNSIYKELFLTDRYGRTVAASGRTTDYLQADEAWWTESFRDGIRGQLAVSDALYDQSSRTWGIEISVPVEAPAGGELAGVLKIVADIRELSAVLGGVRMGVTGDAVLLREDGSVVFSLRAFDANSRFFAADLLRERLAAMAKAQPQTVTHFSASEPDGSQRMVGVAFSQLKASYPHLKWVVAVSQADNELFAPVRAQATSLVIVLGLTAVAVLLLALWYSVRLAAPPEPAEMDLHLVQHPRVHRIAESDEEAAEDSAVKQGV